MPASIVPICLGTQCEIRCTVCNRLFGQGTFTGIVCTTTPQKILGICGAEIHCCGRDYLVPRVFKTPNDIKMWLQSIPKEEAIATCGCEHLDSLGEFDPGDYRNIIKYVFEFFCQRCRVGHN